MRKPVIVSKDFGWVFWGCDHEALVSLKMNRKIGTMVAQAGFTVYKNTFQKFPGVNGKEGGYTSVIIIGESCVDIHTWPEEGTAHIRIFYCDFTQCNSKKKDTLLAFFEEVFKPAEVEQIIERHLRIKK